LGTALPEFTSVLPYAYSNSDFLSALKTGAVTDLHAERSS